MCITHDLCAQRDVCMIRTIAESFFFFDNSREHKYPPVCNEYILWNICPRDDFWKAKRMNENNTYSCRWISKILWSKKFYKTRCRRIQYDTVIEKSKSCRAKSSLTIWQVLNKWHYYLELVNSFEVKLYIETASLEKKVFIFLLQ